MRTLSLTLIAALTALILWPSQADATSGAGVRRYALVVGANDGGATRVRLSYATTDAQTFAGVMTELGGVNQRDLILLLDPTKAEVEASFAELGERVAQADSSHARTEVIFYYSGHSDEEGLRMGDALYPYVELKDHLFAVGSDVRLAVLDSCASGALTRVKGGSFQAPFLMDDANKVKGYAILTSSSADEAAQESERLQASFFTHSLVSGLRGAADTTGDSRVTLNEVYNFAFNDTLARTEKTNVGAQHPAYDIQLAGTGDLILTDLRDTSAVLALADELDGRVYVRDDAGRLVLEVRKIGGQKMDLALAPGGYNITVQLEGELRQGDILLREGDREPLDLGSFAQVTPEQVALRGDGDINVNININNAPPPPAEPPCGESRRTQLNLLNYAEAVDGTQIALVANRVNCNMKGFQATLGLNSVGRDLDGVQIALGPNIVNGDTKGAQLSTATNITWGMAHGLQATSGFNVAVEGATGLQAAAGFNYSGGGTGRAQAAAGFNIAGGSIKGGQGSAGFNVAGGDVHGIQGAAGFNVAAGDVRGLQGAAGFNIASGDVKGVQVAAGFNIAGGKVEGAQASAGFQRAGSVDGIQVSVINVSGDVDGAQVGIINVARNVKGSQVGIINIARDVDGLPIGLLNFVKEGQRHFSVWGDDLGHTNVSFLFGSDTVYTQFQAGVSPTHKGRYTWGMGFGLHFQSRKWWVDPVVSAQQVYDADIGWTDLNMLNQGQVLIGRQFFKRFSLYAGPSFNVHVAAGEGTKTDLANIPSKCQCSSDSDVEVNMWPGLVFGIRI